MPHNRCRHTQQSQEQHGWGQTKIKKGQAQSRRGHNKCPMRSAPLSKSDIQKKGEVHLAPFQFVPRQQQVAPTTQIPIHQITGTPMWHMRPMTCPDLFVSTNSQVPHTIASIVCKNTHGKSRTNTPFRPRVLRRRVPKWQTWNPQVRKLNSINMVTCQAI